MSSPAGYPSVDSLGACNLGQLKTAALWSRSQQPNTDSRARATQPGTPGCHEKMVNPKSQEIIPADVYLSSPHNTEWVKVVWELSPLLTFVNPREVGPIIVPILCVREPRLNRVKILGGAGC